MNQIKKFSRIIITMGILIIQLILFVIILVWFKNYLPIITAASYLLSILIVLWLVRINGDPAVRIAWIILIMAFPVYGGTLYLLFGSRRPVKKMCRRISDSHSKIAAYLFQKHTVLQAIDDDYMKGMVKYIKNYSSYPIYGNTSSKYYSFGEQMYQDMLNELSKAKEYIFVEYFIIDEKSDMWNGMLDILLKKASEGVDVRIMYDDIGSVNSFSLKHLAKIKDADIKILPFNPFIPAIAIKMNNRDHRKILVIDGHTVFNGGINIADEYINKDNRLGVWKDTGVMLKGEAVNSFSLMFLELWNAFCIESERVVEFTKFQDTGIGVEHDGFVLPYGDSPLDDEVVAENIYIEILNQSRNYVTIFTPFLIISGKMIHALQMAAKRGVNVTLVTPGIPDKDFVYRMSRSYYKDLLLAGVNIFEFTPGFLHAKSFICDDVVAVVGTVNMDYRSLYLNFECATLLYKTKSINELKLDTIKTIEVSRRVTLADCERGPIHELITNILHIFAPLL